MIVFDEAEMLPHSLAALAPAFSSFVIADMGSSDQTLSMIRGILGERARIVHYDRSALFQEGYAAARDFCAKHATTPWILAVDADEVLLSGHGLQNIDLDRSIDSIDSATIERRNLIKWDGTLPTEGRPIEQPRRLYRTDGPVSWTGYIHEELAVDGRVGAVRTGHATLVFNHLTALRNPARIVHRKNMYAWMVLRAARDPAIRGGTNSWWFEKFLPEKEEEVGKAATEFEASPDFLLLVSATQPDKGSALSNGERPALQRNTRIEVLSKLWRGHDPLAEVPVKHLAADLQGWNSDHPYLRDVVKNKRPRLVAEIGVWKGASTINLANAIRASNLDAVVIAVDTWLGSWDHWTQDQWHRDLLFESGYPSLYWKFLANIRVADVCDIVVPLPLDSANAAEVLQKADLALDLLHLDGAHDYCSVKSDLHRWWRLLRPGGVLIADDYFTDGKTWPEVRRAVDEFLENHPHIDFQYDRGKCQVTKHA